MFKTHLLAQFKEWYTTQALMPPGDLNARVVKFVKMRSIIAKIVLKVTAKIN